MVQPATPSTRVALAVVQRTDPGLDPDKQVNEDASGYAELSIGHLLVVCDGMGGHLGGREASNRAVRTIMTDVDRARPDGAPGQVLKNAIEHAGAVVYELGGSGHNPLRPGSTCVALLVHKGGVEVAHVGDSRAYLLRADGIYAITRDHSMVQQMVDAGVLSPQEAIGHPDANKITRALGMLASVEVELRPQPLPAAKGDIFLLASDGLCDLVMPHEMLGLVQQSRAARGLEFACDQLIALANSRGGHDNITVVLGEVLEMPPAPAYAESESVQRSMTLPIVEPDSLGVQRTMIDEEPPTVSATRVRSDFDSKVTHTLIEHDVDELDEASDPTSARKRLLVTVGILLLLCGVALVAVSIWWAYSNATMDSMVPGSADTVLASSLQSEDASPLLRRRCWQSPDCPSPCNEESDVG